MDSRLWINHCLQPVPLAAEWEEPTNYSNTRWVLPLLNSVSKSIPPFHTAVSAKLSGWRLTVCKSVRSRTEDDGHFDEIERKRLCFLKLSLYTRTNLVYKSLLLNRKRGMRLALTWSLVIIIRWSWQDSIVVTILASFSVGILIFRKPRSYKLTEKSFLLSKNIESEWAGLRFGRMLLHKQSSKIGTF